MNKFDNVYNKIISECNTKNSKKHIIKESIVTDALDIIDDVIENSTEDIIINEPKLNENFLGEIINRISKLNLTSNDVQNLINNCYNLSQEYADDDFETSMMWYVIAKELENAPELP